MPSTSTSELMIWVICERLALAEPGPLTTATSLSPVDFTKAVALSVFWARTESGRSADTAASSRKFRREIIGIPSSGNGMRLFRRRVCRLRKPDGRLRKPDGHGGAIVITQGLDLGTTVLA